MIDPFTDEQFEDFDLGMGPSSTSTPPARLDETTREEGKSGSTRQTSLYAPLTAASLRASTDVPTSTPRSPPSVYAPATTPDAARQGARESVTLTAAEVKEVGAVAKVSERAAVSEVCDETRERGPLVAGAATDEGAVSPGVRPGMRDKKPLGIFCSLCREEASSRSELLGHVADAHPNVLDLKEMELASLRDTVTVSIGELLVR